MLISLHIENIAVVKNADIDFKAGLTVLTGETGAGKSVIIDSINLLTGTRVSRDIIRFGEQYALSEAVFDNVSETVLRQLAEAGIDCNDGQIVITNKLMTDGRSTPRINGRTVTKTLLKDISRQLISIHGQNDEKNMFTKSSYFNMIDSYGDCFGDREEYFAVYSELEMYRKKLLEYSTDENEKERRKDILEYQINDIDSKRLKDGEEEALEDEKIRLSHIEKINKHINFAVRVLSGGERGGDIPYMLSRASESLSKISDFVPEATNMAESLLDMSYNIADTVERIKALSSLDDDPNDMLDKVETRLEEIAVLKKRYGKSIKEILKFRENAANELDGIVSSSERAEECEAKIAELEKEAALLADALTEKRKVAAFDISSKIKEALSYLDMPDVSFDVAVSPSGEFTPFGRDRVELLAATNPSEPMLPVSDIASGGESSRIMLAIKSTLNEKDGVGCSVYDEIDTGISGKTSRKIGIKLREISSGSQVLCVTHSAQIATLADNHYLISKKEIGGRAHTSIRELCYEERVEEAARILGGINVTEAQRQAARDMLDSANE